MAIRGKVKDIRMDSMNRAFGTVTDLNTKTDYPFEQPYGKQLGLEINSIVQFDTVLVGFTTYGVSLDPVEKGTIQSIDYEKGTGILVDKVGNELQFEQNYGSEMGLLPGSKVKYAIVNVNGQIRATALRLPNS